MILGPPARPNWPEEMAKAGFVEPTFAVAGGQTGGAWCWCRTYLGSTYLLRRCFDHPSLHRGLSHGMWIYRVYGSYMKLLGAPGLTTRSKGHRY